MIEWTLYASYVNEETEKLRSVKINFMGFSHLDGFLHCHFYLSKAFKAHF